MGTRTTCGGSLSHCSVALIRVSRALEGGTRQRMGLEPAGRLATHRWEWQAGHVRGADGDHGCRSKAHRGRAYVHPGWGPVTGQGSLL